MKYRDMTEAGALAIATNIKAAVWDRDRNRMAALSRAHGGLGRITNLLVATGFMTRKERFAALAMMPRIRNASCKIRV